MKIEFFSDSDRASIISKHLDVPVVITNSDKECPQAKSTKSYCRKENHQKRDVFE